ncbi:hypothetical protein QQM39_10830 [Streptomyces sp. DT2A-34]|uniref:hypothetical protein n=1 Tax=Streptomyces sp. DT2A-34 TaxID=3051182 RepID=UPI00265C6575|nr:hypothetical protein [Streptomyces sp. DT2A-34]MDO0911327.1 hypothetical protein [Streptomyces sp. DT2A-34]
MTASANVIYTSLTGAGDHLGSALAHRATERLLQASGLQCTILRNVFYAELFGGLLMWADDGVESAFDDGPLAAVVREDLAEAAAIVAASDPARHSGRVYDLVGTPITAGQWPIASASRPARQAWASTGAGSSPRRQDCCRSSRPCSPRSPPASDTAFWTAPPQTSRASLPAQFAPPGYGRCSHFRHETENEC